MISTTSRRNRAAVMASRRATEEPSDIGRIVGGHDPAILSAGFPSSNHHYFAVDGSSHPTSGA